MDPQLTLCHSNLLSHQINMIVILHKLSKVLTKQFIVLLGCNSTIIGCQVSPSLQGRNSSLAAMTCYDHSQQREALIQCLD